MLSSWAEYYTPPQTLVATISVLHMIANACFIEALFRRHGLREPGLSVEADPGLNVVVYQFKEGRGGGGYNSRSQLHGARADEDGTAGPLGGDGDPLLGGALDQEDVAGRIDGDGAALGGGNGEGGRSVGQDCGFVGFGGLGPEGWQGLACRKLIGILCQLRNLDLCCDWSICSDRVGRLNFRFLFIRSFFFSVRSRSDNARALQLLTRGLLLVCVGVLLLELVCGHGASQAGRLLRRV